MLHQLLFVHVEMDTSMMVKVIYVSLAFFNVKFVKLLKQIALPAEEIDNQVNAFVQMELMTIGLVYIANHATINASNVAIIHQFHV